MNTFFLGTAISLALTVDLAFANCVRTAMSDVLQGGGRTAHARANERRQKTGGRRCEPAFLSACPIRRWYPR